MALGQASGGSVVTPWGPVRQIDAGVLDVGYIDAGPADGPAVVLLHGWPYDIPKWHFDDATFERTAQAFDNPDHVAIVIDNDRWRIGLSVGEPTHAALEQQLAAGPVITVPTVTLEGDANGAPHLEPSAYADEFVGPYAHRTITGGVGHNLPQEAPEAFADAILEIRDHLGAAL